MASVTAGGGTQGSTQYRLCIRDTLDIVAHPTNSFVNPPLSSRQKQSRSFLLVIHNIGVYASSCWHKPLWFTQDKRCIR